MRVCGTCNPKDRTNKRVTKIYVKDEAVNALNDAEGTSVYVSISGGGAKDNTVVNMPNENLRRLIFRKLKAIDGTTYLNRTYKDPFTQSDVDKITDLTGDYSIGNNVADLTGLERFTKLKRLELFPEGVTNIDITGLSSLEELEIAGGTIQTVTGVSNALKKISLTKAGNLTKLDLTKVSSIETINIVEQSTGGGSIECIALPPNKVGTIKDNLYVKKENGTIDNDKTDLYRSKVQSTPCN